MKEIEQDLLDTLTKLSDTVQTMKTAQIKPDLMPIFTRLDELTGILPGGTSPRLLHYLHKKSYEKARLWLEGRDEENATGACVGD